MAHIGQQLAELDRALTANTNWSEMSARLERKASLLSALSHAEIAWLEASEYLERDA